MEVLQRTYITKKQKHYVKIGVEKQMHNGADEKFAITLNYLLTVASRSAELFKSSKVEQKRALINFVLSNPSLKDGKLQYELKKPFDIIERFSDCLDWLPIYSTLRTSRQKKILDLYSECQRYDFEGIVFQKTVKLKNASQTRNQTRRGYCYS